MRIENEFSEMARWIFFTKRKREKEEKRKRGKSKQCSQNRRFNFIYCIIRNNFTPAICIGDKMRRRKNLRLFVCDGSKDLFVFMSKF